MDKLLCSALVLLIFFYHATLSTPNVNPQTYIIHMETSKISYPFPSHHSWYMSMLSSLSSPESILPVHLYTYTHVLSGFSAVLTGSHLQQLQRMPGHVAAYEESFGHLHTTHTSQFLGLNLESGLWPISKFGDDMIIGIVDTGIWPESQSFNDDGMPPIPRRWRGTCEIGPTFTGESCNNKLIGARSFSKGLKSSGIVIHGEYDSPRDADGHGTAISSIAAGIQVPFANYFGYANGTATGIASRARLAIYKTKFRNENISHNAAATDILAGIDQAIEDGVDVISLSSGFSDTKFYLDPVAIGTFAAMEKGIFISCSAGNDGPNGSTIDSGAPWITTVGAGTIDRNLSAGITLGNTGTYIVGKSLYPENALVDRVRTFFGLGNRSKEICESLDPSEVKGKYVFCDFSKSGKTQVKRQLFVVSSAGAGGGIFTTDSWKFMNSEDFTGAFVIINRADGEVVKKYINENGNTNSTVSIKFQVTLLGTKPAPQVANFSSRGPVPHSPCILKPDLLAPGVDILAAWAPNREINVKMRDSFLLTDYNILSGTSMSAPHVAGVAALLKSVHKEWSPAAIRSAMMTTAYVMDNANNNIIDLYDELPASPLDFGAGHINPNMAMDPGLVYDLQIEDYINYMCALNYTVTQLQTITRRSNVSCEKANIDLNYPSFIVILNNINTTRASFTRALTNVVDGNCTYSAIVETPNGMKVLVEPSVIHFSGKLDKSEFKLTVEIDLGYSAEVDYLGNYGYLSWKQVNGSHVVRSPIVSAYLA